MVDPESALGVAVGADVPETIDLRDTNEAFCARVLELMETGMDRGEAVVYLAVSSCGTVEKVA